MLVGAIEPDEHSHIGGVSNIGRWVVKDQSLSVGSDASVLACPSIRLDRIIGKPILNVNRNTDIERDLFC
jgi:hypothetical protein